MSNRSSMPLDGLLILAGAILGGFVGAQMTGGSFWGIMAGVMDGLIFGTAAIALGMILLACALIAAFVYAIQYAKIPIFFLVVAMGLLAVGVIHLAKKSSSSVEYAPVVTKKTVSQVSSMLGRGMKVKEIADATGFSTSTVYRIKNQKYDLSSLPDR